MKNVLVLLVTVLALNLSSAQWENKFYVDDFGEATDKSYKIIVADGVFSNSATTNSKASYKIIEDDGGILIHVYEYGTNLATEIENTFEEVRLKTPSGEVVKFDKIFFWKKGSLLFNDENHQKLSKAIASKGNYVMIFNRSGKYSESSYKIKFSIN